MRFFSSNAVVFSVGTIMISLWLTGCAAFSDRGKLDAFKETIKNYRYAILLSNFEQAKILSDPHSTADPTVLKNFHVVSYTSQKIEFSNDKSKAFQTVDIEYYRVDSMRQKTIRDLQEWAYQPAIEQWILKSGLPQFN